MIKEFISSDRNIDRKLFPEDQPVDIQLLLNQNNSDGVKTYRFITFVDLRKIFDTLSISIEAELVEYLIYMMKSSFKDEKASLYDLNYLALVELLNSEAEENDDGEKSNIEELEQSYEISPEQYEKILSGIFTKIKNFAARKKLSPAEIFQDDVALVEEENTKERYSIIELKDFIEKLDTVVGLDIKELEVYCLYTKLKFDEVENDLEAISFTKLIEELEADSSKIVNNKSYNTNVKRLKLNDLSKDLKDKESTLMKGSIIQSSNFKQIEGKAKDSSKKENKENNVYSLRGFIEELKIYMKTNDKTLDDIVNKLKNDLEGLQKTSKKVSVSLLNSFLKKEKIINGFVNLNDLADFAIIDESNEDIMINIDGLFDFIRNVLKEDEEENHFEVQENTMKSPTEVKNKDINKANISKQASKDSKNIEKEENKEDQFDGLFDKDDLKSDSGFEKDMQEVLFDDN